MQLELKNGINLNVDQFKGIVTHNDLDLISALALYNYLDIPIKGIFELHQSQYTHSKLIVSEELTKENINDFLYVDLALKHDTITTIDHHGTLSEVYKLNENIINANRYYSKSYDILQYGAVKHKNPLSCLNFILYLLGVDISSFNEEQKILLCLPDGLHSVYHTYRNNVETWLEMFNQNSLIDTLQDTPLKQFDQMRERIGSGTNKYFNYSEVAKEFIWSYKKPLQDTINIVCEIMDWKKPIIPKMKIIYLYNNSSVYATPNNVESLMSDKNVISICVNRGDSMIGYSRFTGNSIDLPN